jgi:hypothetical protein
MRTPDDRHSERDRLADLARRHAAQLRADAIDDFWSTAGDAARRTLRAARRFAASLARHQRLRAGQG